MRGPAKRLVIVGVAGRMGREIEALAESKGFRVTGGISRVTAPLVGGLQTVASLSEVKAADCDVVIDFSAVAMAEDVLNWCRANKKPLVSGLTGLSETALEKYRAAGSEIPVLWAPNMSRGVAVLKRMVAALGQLEDFDFQIEEFHHTRKLDKPSGTAIALQQALAKVVTKPLPDPIAIRGGGIFGIHRVFAMGEEEMITLDHTAISRRVFARGALRAGQWLLGRKPGFYGIDDTLS